MAKKNHESDVSFIRELAVLLKEHDLTELEVARDYGENDNLNVRVARQKTSLPQQHITIPQQTIDSSDVAIVACCFPLRRPRLNRGDAEMVSPSSSCPGSSVSKTANFTKSFQGFSSNVNSGHLPTALRRRDLIVLNPASRQAARYDSCIAPPTYRLGHRLSTHRRHHFDKSKRN